MSKILNYHEEPITEALHSIIERWRDEEGNLIMIFHAIQKEYGYVPRNVSIFVSEELHIPLARIYEITTFYNYFTLEPPADNTIAVCMGTACYLKGMEDVLGSFRKELSIKAGKDYSEDRRYKIEEVRCLGCCVLAPVITFNGEVIGHLSASDVPKVIKEKSKEGE